MALPACAEHGSFAIVGGPSAGDTPADNPTDHAGPADAARPDAVALDAGSDALAASDADDDAGDSVPSLPVLSQEAVLALVNEAPFDRLDKPEEEDGVGLDRRAARNIVDHRMGPDGVDGTDDDDPFDDLSELDAVPYVGPSALDRLFRYAVAHGYGPRTR
jgi:hypothetical protein